MKRLLIIVIVSLVFGGCSKKEIVESVEPVNIQNEEVITKVYDVTYEMTRPTTNVVYTENVYVGAFIGNETYKWDIGKWESNTKKHAVYIYPIDVNEDVSKIQKFMLQCISTDSIPYFIMQNPTGYYTYTSDYINDMTKAIGAFNYPVILEPLAYPSQSGLGVAEYNKLYETVYNSVKKNIKLGDVAYSLDILDSVSSIEYYPKNSDMVDFVSIKNNINTNVSTENIFNGFDYLYYKFYDKPIICNVAISYFDTEAHTYYQEDAKNKIIKFYNEIQRSYDNVQIVTYMDYDFVINQKPLMQNYNISGEKILLETYKNAIYTDYFVGNVDINNTMETSKVVEVKTPFKAIDIDGNVWVDVRALYMYDSIDGYTKTEGDVVYINIDDVIKCADNNGDSVTVHEYNKKVKINVR